MVGVVAATALVGGLVGAGTAGAFTPSSETKSVQAADSSVRAPSATKPGTRCKAKQKGKTRETMYGKLKCTKKGKKNVWKWLVAQAPRPPAPANPPNDYGLDGDLVPPAACGTVGATGPGGGKIFYVDMSRSVGSQCFEAAPDGWNGGADPTAEWDCQVGNGINVVTATWIGAGEANTTRIVGSCDTVGIAARLANAYVAPNSTAGWFLPSMDELNQLCKFARAQSTTVANRTVVCGSGGTLQGGFTAGYYWSSSQYAASLAWFQLFGSGFQGSDGKANAYRVRPVRDF